MYTDRPVLKHRFNDLTRGEQSAQGTKQNICGVRLFDNLIYVRYYIILF
jgi:hypothetical protein